MLVVLDSNLGKFVMQQQLTDTYILLGFLPSLSCFPHTLPSLPREHSCHNSCAQNPHPLPGNQPTHPCRIYAMSTAYMWRGEELFPHRLTTSCAIKLKLKWSHELGITRGLLIPKRIPERGFVTHVPLLQHSL